MSSTKSQEIIILHVDMKYEADSVIETLRKDNIPAYCSATPDPNPLGLPGAIGINETGYDIFVLKTDAAAASEILAGIGYKSLVEDDDTAVDSTAAEDGDSSPRELTDEEKRQRLQQSIDELSTGKRIWYSICFAFFALVGLTIFVVICDWLVALIKSLF